MKKHLPSTSQDQDSQLGGTDQIEQMAADLANKENHSKVTDEDRKEALEQMQEMSPPAKTSQR
ncbi:hypothetical protein EI77_01818 [Prosthecobacter fusiformis]|uniref:Uncharacterized protein n=1 Tax=Prosthecobacter fusiformis TaxID=48464 RepID=A0A4R7S6Z4_9BACT|nr:hypothetical protein [Prosthecobacter fusiformis]TDU73348.1 hypothetical protein EI77_01818 [Prosthecobacter fusiformis]